MNLVDCYRTLGLREGADLQEVKASYRRLARQCHPDANPDNQQAQDKFVRLTQAYKKILAIAEPPSTPPRRPSSPSAPGIVDREGMPAIAPELKQRSYQQLQQLLKDRRFPRAIALVEGLVQRLPEDLEVRQWQAITYQSWGRQLVQDNQLDKARVYFKKALRLIPNNRTFCLELERDIQRLEAQLQAADVAQDSQGT